MCGYGFARVGGDIVGLIKERQTLVATMYTTNCRHASWEFDGYFYPYVPGWESKLFPCTLSYRIPEIISLPSLHPVERSPWHVDVCRFGLSLARDFSIIISDKMRSPPSAGLHSQS
ncbi:hypothetical protein BD311DRAFT_759267 [Dichomitus squalens]|uniref:Uncharacterized protein n=1 Tax=Dichomitus squalens TaxID=114155 RepID=A0A4Q9MPC8_9APHY|nr:hypothetical protein BD311DRAFT_759267 [Dichomitus squalens]